MTTNVGGPASAHVPDSTKIVCPRCNGTLFQISSTLDDPNDIVQDKIFAALLITFPSGASCQGLVAMCLHCGNEFVPFWMLFDIGASNGTTITMTNLVTATTANLLADYYLAYLGTDATDLRKYFTIASNSAADPCVITPDGTINVATDGLFMLTNILPVGFTLGA